MRSCHKVILWATAVLAASSAFAEPPNLAANPSFESGNALPSDWIAANPKNAAFMRDVSRARTGRASAMVETKPGDDYPSFKYRIPAKPGEEYEASVWARSEMVSGKGYVVFEYWKGEQRLEFAQGSYTGGNDNDWILLRASGCVPEGADSIVFALVAHGEGKTWFDDAEVVRTADAPAELSGDSVTVNIRSRETITPYFHGFGAQGDFFLTVPSNTKYGVGPEDIELVKKRVRDMRPAVLRLFFSYAWWEPEEGRQTPDSDEIRDMVEWMKFLKATNISVLLCPWGDYFASSPWMNATARVCPRPTSARRWCAVWSISWSSCATNRDSTTCAILH